MSIISLLFEARQTFSEWRRGVRAYGDVVALNDHLLADIGLHRSQIPVVFGGIDGACRDCPSCERACGGKASDRPDAQAPIRPSSPARAPSTLKGEPPRSRPMAPRAEVRRSGAARLLLAAATMAVAGSASAAGFGVAARHGISPTQPFSSSATTPLQQQIQQDYRSNLLSAQRDLLQANPSGLGRQQIELQHQLDTLPP
jgi:uncharacterized protein YjiS (DUF1127 family)